MDLTYRGLGPWGPGKGANLQAAEVDNNFWAVATAIVNLQTNPALPNGIASISVSGTQMTITLANGDVMGPFTLPVLTFRWRDEWQPSTPYAELDVFKVTDRGIYAVEFAHVSGDTFDPNIEVGGAPALLQLFGSADARLSELPDVLLSGLADQDFLQWIAADSKWENVALGGMAYQNSDSVAITGGTITGMPTPINPSDVVTKAYADALPAGATVPDATMLANISGATNAPTPETLSDYLDYVFNTTNRGCIIFRSGSGWVAMQPGANGLYLQTQGAGLDPHWAPGGAGISALYAGTGIDIGSVPITTTGTIALAPLPDGDLLANISGASAAPVPITLAQLLDHVLGTARGQLITRTVAGWTALGPGPAGQYLKTQGLGADLVWDSPPGAGTVTSVGAGSGISTGGSPITAAGTVALAAIADSTMLANVSGSSAVPVPTSFTALLDHDVSPTQGSVLYRSATGWVALTPGTVGQILTTGGAAANPSWQNVPAGAAIPNLRILSNISGGSAVPTAHSLSDLFDAMVSSARGTMFFRTNSGWVGLAPGTAGQVLTTGGVSSDPHWTAGSAAALAGLSDVTLTSPTDQDQLTFVASTAKWQNKTLGSVLDAALGNTQGQILYRGATGWVALAPGTSGQVLTTGGAAANPAWGLPSVTTPPVNDSDLINYRTFLAAPVKIPCGRAAAAPLPSCTYANGSGGVGATLTGTANGALSIDGAALNTGDTVLIPFQVAALQNGIYTLTQQGDSSHPFILTRPTYYDSNTGATGLWTEKIKNGDLIIVTQGSTYADTLWMLVNSGSGAGGLFQIGTDALSFAQVGGTNIVTTTGTGVSFNVSGVSDRDTFVYDTATGKWVNRRPKYNIGCYVPGAPLASQNLLFHKLSKAVTIPANFGSYLGHVSEAGAATAATASAAIDVARALAASPTSFATVGTITFAAAGASATFTSTGGAAISFAQGDVLRLRAPASPDATLADFFATIVGYET